MKKFTIIALVFAITAVFAVSAMANEWNLYGSARMATFYTQRDYGKIFTDDDNPGGNDIFGKDNFKATQWAMQGNSRIGATVKGDMLEGRFEFGVTSDGAGGNVSARRLYGVWHFTEGWGLKVGKDYTPITFFLSGQVFDSDAGLLQVGNAYGSRRAQLAIEGKLGPGMFKFAAIDQTQANISFTTVDPATGVVTALDTQTESYWPKLETSYQMMFGDNMSVHAFGGFQSTKYYTNNPVTGADGSKTLSSYMVGLGGEFNFGPMFVKPQVSYYYNGQSAGWLGLQTSNLVSYSGLPAGTAADISEFGPIVVNGDADNIKTTMAMLALGFSPTEALTLEGGIGWNYNKSDGNQSIDKNTYLEYYLQAVWKMAPSVYLIPEVGYRDFGDLKFSTANTPDIDLGSLFYFGAKWQIDF
jgi:hypothetical protein